MNDSWVKVNPLLAKVPYEIDCIPGMCWLRLSGTPYEHEVILWSKIHKLTYQEKKDIIVKLISDTAPMYDVALCKEEYCKIISMLRKGGYCSYFVQKYYAKGQNVPVTYLNFIGYRHYSASVLWECINHMINFFDGGAMCKNYATEYHLFELMRKLYVKEKVDVFKYFNEE